MRISLYLLIASALSAGCGPAPVDPHTSTPRGAAELRVDTSFLQAFAITRVTVEAAGVSQDLVRDPSGVFVGTLLIPPGMQTLRARAFAGDTQVGASQPTAVTVTTGSVTRVMLRILDTTDPPPIFGPIFDSLAFPTSLEVGVAGTFALSVVAPGGDPVTYAWSSDCADSTFSAPDAATTSWSKPTPGSCAISVTATSNGFPISQNFRIVVFPANTDTGAADVTAVFVSAPVVVLNLPGVQCGVSLDQNASCANTIASPQTTFYSAFVVSWGGSSPGTLELSDDCGGREDRQQQNLDSIFGTWLPPVSGGLCRITARAVSSDGVAGRVVAAILARPGVPPTTQPTGPSPFAVAVADVSGDGRPDLIVAVVGPGTVSVMRGNGDGSFRTRLDAPTGRFPRSVAVTDVSGDGKPDIIAVNESDNTVSVLLGNGDGTFQARVDYPTGNIPLSVAVADVSGDGKPDIIVASLGTNTVNVLLGNGDGTFRAKVDYPTGTSAWAVAVADVNGDAKPDIEVADIDGRTVSVLLGNGDGTFQAKVDYATGGRPSSVAVADVNGDGKPDLVTANIGSDSNSATVSVLLGNGDGTFQAKVDYPTGSDPMSVAVADVSGDGIPDVVTANSSANTASVLLGHGNGTFQAKVDYSTGLFPVSVVVADVNGDGRPDLLVANENSQTVSVLLGTGSGRF
ncbi:MAG TPA: VCBS repeat-containing protein [Kofleriaceae bacterium]